MSITDSAESTAPEDTIAVTVVSRRSVADQVCELTFARPDGGPLPAWEPGAHIDVILPSGKIRQYSLCGDPSVTSTYVIAVLAVEDGRGGSAEVHSTLLENSSFSVSAPRNSFPLADEATGYEFVAGGIGITPLLPMIEQVADSGLPWRLTYASRSAAKMAFHEELTEKYGNKISVHYDEVDGVFDVQEWLQNRDRAASVYACGPGAMLTALESVLKDSDADFHSERFAVSDDPAGAFEVLVNSSGARIQVGADSSILEALENAGLTPSFSCRVGVCGACTTSVLDGEVDHRDQVLSEDDHGVGRKMTLCVSRSHSGTLVLDL